MYISVWQWVILIFAIMQDYIDLFVTVLFTVVAGFFQLGE
jgi:hypothetical protein